MDFVEDLNVRFKPVLTALPALYLTDAQCNLMVGKISDDRIFCFGWPGFYTSADRDLVAGTCRVAWKTTDQRVERRVGSPFLWKFAVAFIPALGRSPVVFQHPAGARYHVNLATGITTAEAVELSNADDATLTAHLLEVRRQLADFVTRNILDEDGLYHVIDEDARIDAKKH